LTGPLRLRRREDKAFHARIPKSLKLWQKAKGLMPNGVPMSWMLGLHRRPASLRARRPGSPMSTAIAISTNLSDLSATTGFATRRLAVPARQRRAAPNSSCRRGLVTVSELLKARTGMPWQFTLAASGAPEAFASPARHGRRRIVMLTAKTSHLTKYW
jgi:glutamate-1-semialdehyde 2,1-aminomutase